MPETPTAIGPLVAATHHPLYDRFLQEWVKLAHVREGTGGFQDGTYLIAHPREWEDFDAKVPIKPTRKLKARRALASYENLASTILETKKSSLFRESPTRRVGDDPSAVNDLTDWWQTVDGGRMHIDDAMPLWWDLAATFGHLVLYFELPVEPGLTAAESGLPYVRVYTPLDVIDWLEDDAGRVTSIKVTEAIPAEDYRTIATTNAYRTRIIDETGWRVYSSQGTPEASGEHKLGRVPFVFLYGKRRTLYPQIGQSVLGDPRLYIDLFNLESELRELLRNQTFSFINLPLGVGTDSMSVETAQTLLGQQTGTMNVLFSAQPADILTGDSANVTAYHESIDRKRREIYRGAGVPWEQDSKSAETEGALGLKREDLNIKLAAYADECQRVEYELVELFYRWRLPDQWESNLEGDKVVIQYPDRFADLGFKELQEQIAAATDASMPPLFMKALRKALVSKFEGLANLPEAELEAILNDIDAAEEEPSPADLLKMRLEAQARPVPAVIPDGSPA